MNYTLRTAIISCMIASTVALSGCVIHVGGGDGSGVSSVFGNVSVSEGKEVGDVSSVNGNVELADSVRARHVDAVNGNLEMGDNVTIAWGNTVNGNIETGTGFYSEGKIETTNGNIHLGKNSEVVDNVETVNGDIELPAVKVGGSLVTHTGDIILTEGTSISGDIVFRKRSRSSSWFGRDETPTLRVDATVTLNGDIVLQRPVILELADPAMKSKVIEEYHNH